MYQSTTSYLVTAAQHEGAVSRFFLICLFFVASKHMSNVRKPGIYSVNVNKFHPLQYRIVFISLKNVA